MKVISKKIVRKILELMKKLAKEEESGEEEDTIVVFLSDHGMPLPFAKTQLYHHSTRTPLIIRWPGVVQPGTVDTEKAETTFKKNK